MVAMTLSLCLIPRPEPEPETVISAPEPVVTPVPSPVVSPTPESSPSPSPESTPEASPEPSVLIPEPQVTFQPSQLEVPAYQSTPGVTAECNYVDATGAYKFLLCCNERDVYSLTAEYAPSFTMADSRTELIPSKLVIYRQDGTRVGAEFLDKVTEIGISAHPLDGGSTAQVAEGISTRVDAQLGALILEADIVMNTDCRTNAIHWTLGMENGVTLIMQQEITIYSSGMMEYFPESTPMETAEDLQALLDKIAADPLTISVIYLPPVTYTEPLVIRGGNVQLYGSQDGEHLATFQGGLTVQGQQNSVYLDSLSFPGNGGTGLRCETAVRMGLCTFTGWDVAVEAVDGGFACIRDSVLEFNTVALRLDTEHCHDIDGGLLNNIFRHNGTAIDAVTLPPEPKVLLRDSSFFGNQMDLSGSESGFISTEGANFLG